MPNRNFANGNYRYGFGSHEKDDEVKGSGNHLSFGDYGYDPRTGRRWNVDPLAHLREWVSPYNFVQNNPILRIDPTGLLDTFGLNSETGDITKIDNKKYYDNDGNEVDKLVDSKTNETVSENVSKGLLSDGLNLKTKGLETNNYKGGMKLAYDISIHTSTEIGGVVYKSSNGDRILNIFAYGETKYFRDKNGEVDGMQAGFRMKILNSWTSSDGSFTGIPTATFHTHPGHPESNYHIGGPTPSNADMLGPTAAFITNGRTSYNIHKKIKHYIFAKKNATYKGVTSNVSTMNSNGIYKLNKKNVNQILKN